jgi:PAS domain-containing protein
VQQRREVAEAVAGQGSVEIDPARILDLVVDAIYMRSFADGRIQYWNAGAEAMYGWSAAEAILP